MMVKKAMVLTFLLGLSVAGLGRADGWEANLNAGNTSVFGGVHYKKDIQTGYMKTGVSGLYTDDDDLEYKWAQLKFAVGSENVQPGLTMELGVNAIVGDAEKRGFSGDVGAIAFDGYIGYMLPKQILPLPIEVFGGLTYAPEVLAFRDSEDFLSYRIGVGVHVVRNASINVEYQTYDIDMESGPGPWNLDDDVFRLSLIMQF